MAENKAIGFKAETCATEPVLPVNGPLKPPVKNHFSLHFHLYSFEYDVYVFQKPFKILVISIFGLDDVCGCQHILCPDLQPV